MISGSPLSLHKAALSTLNALPLSEIATGQGTFTVAGIIKSLRVITTKRGQPMAFMATAFGQDEIQKIYLFGSYSRGEATVKSDVDFFILVGKEISFMRRAEFNGLLRNALGKSVDTLFSDDRIPDEVLQNIQKDKRLVYEFQSR